MAWFVSTAMYNCRREWQSIEGVFFLLIIEQVEWMRMYFVPTTAQHQPTSIASHSTILFKVFPSQPFWRVCLCVLWGSRSFNEFLFTVIRRSLWPYENHANTIRVDFHVWGDKKPILPINYEISKGSTFNSPKENMLFTVLFIVSHYKLW